MGRRERKGEGKWERRRKGRRRRTKESRVVQMSTCTTTVINDTPESMSSTTVVTGIHVSTAAYVMYEQGLRLGREAPGLKSLQKQVWTMP